MEKKLAYLSNSFESLNNKHCISLLSGWQSEEIICALPETRGIRPGRYEGAGKESIQRSTESVAWAESVRPPQDLMMQQVIKQEWVNSRQWITSRSLKSNLFETKDPNRTRIYFRTIDTSNNLGGNE